MLKCWSVAIGSVPCVSGKTVYRCVTAHCGTMSGVPLAAVAAEYCWLCVFCWYVLGAFCRRIPMFVVAAFRCSWSPDSDVRGLFNCCI
jgi:hypothetical protein